MRMMDVDKLNPHPKNRYFFDDIDGEPWVAFLESIKTSGVIEPIIVSAPDLTIVSGHQRVRACKKLGIKQVAVEERSYESEDEILKQLIETNIRQRGIGNINFVKFGRCERELERIYGIKHGGDRTSGSKSSNGTFGQKTQKDLADESGVSLSTYKRSIQLAELPEEIQQMVMDGKVTSSTASRVIARLTPEEQKALIEQLSGQDKVSSKEVEKYVAEIRRLSEENKRLHDDNKILSRRAEPTVIEKTVEVEVVPDDYEETKKQLRMYKGDNERLNRESKERNKELEEARLRVKELEGRSAEDEMKDKAIREAEYFEIAAYDFIKRCGGYVWLCDRVNDMPEGVSKKFKKALFQLNAMTTKMLEQTGGYIDGE